MREAGVAAKVEREETEDGLVVTVRIPRARAPAK